MASLNWVNYPTLKPWLSKVTTSKVLVNFLLLASRNDKRTNQHCNRGSVWMERRRVWAIMVSVLYENAQLLQRPQRNARSGEANEKRRLDAILPISRGVWRGNGSLCISPRHGTKPRRGFSKDNRKMGGCEMSLACNDGEEEPYDLSGEIEEERESNFLYECARRDMDHGIRPTYWDEPNDDHE